MHSICIILLIQHKYPASLQHRHNWCQLPLRISCRPSRSKGCAPVLEPMVALPFWRLLTSIYPTSVPPTPHPVHPYHPGSKQPVHHHPPRANGGAPVPAPMVALLFWRLLTSVCPTPIPPTPHPVHLSNPFHPSHPGSNQPMRKIQYLLIQTVQYDTIHSIRYDTIHQYNPADTIRSSQQSQYDPAKKSDKSHNNSGTILSCLNAS